jgi:hypothetical protein
VRINEDGAENQTIAFLNNLIDVRQHDYTLRFSWSVFANSQSASTFGAYINALSNCSAAACGGQRSSRSREFLDRKTETKLLFATKHGQEVVILYQTKHGDRKLNVSTSDAR